MVVVPVPPTTRHDARHQTVQTTPIEATMHMQPPPPYPTTPIGLQETPVPFSQAQPSMPMAPIHHNQAPRYQIPAPQQYLSPPYTNIDSQKGQSLEAKGAVLAQQLLPPVIFEKLSSIPQVQRYIQPNPVQASHSHPIQPPTATTTPFAPIPDPFTGSYANPQTPVGPTPGTLPPLSSLPNSSPNPPPTVPPIKELHITTTTSDKNTFFITTPPPTPTSNSTVLYTVTRPPSHPPELAFHRGEPPPPNSSTPTPISTAALATTNEIISTITKFHPYALPPSTDLLLHGHPAMLRGVKKLGSGKVREVESRAGLGIIEWKDCGVGHKHMGNGLVGTSRDGSSGSRGRSDLAWVHPRRWDRRVKDATIVLAGPLEIRALDEVVVSAVAMMEALMRERKVKGRSEGVGGVGEVLGAVLGG